MELFKIKIRVYYKVIKLQSIILSRLRDKFCQTSNSQANVGKSDPFQPAETIAIGNIHLFSTK